MKTLAKNLSTLAWERVSAARTITEQIFKNRPDLVLNVCSAGSLRPDAKGTFVVRNVIEHNMSAEPLELVAGLEISPDICKSLLSMKS